MKNVLVILTGPKRNWIKRQLDKEGIRYLHFSTADEDMLNEFYNILDIYIVASRVEGGPQAIYEAASVGINLISTDVGIANYLLDSESIFDMDNFKIAKPNKHFTNKIIKKHYLPYGIHYFDDFFRSL
jgi:glycosyltransferase involved in cell wall biosynthesis